MSSFSNFLPTPSTSPLLPSLLIGKRCRFSLPSPPTAVPARLQTALAPLRSPPHSGWRAVAVGRVGRSHPAPTAYRAYGADSHRKHCRFFSPSPPTAAATRLRLALAPLRSPPHSCWRAAAVGRVGRTRRVPTAYSAYGGGPQKSSLSPQSPHSSCPHSSCPEPRWRVHHTHHFFSENGGDGQELWSFSNGGA